MSPQPRRRSDKRFVARVRPDGTPRLRPRLVRWGLGVVVLLVFYALSRLMVGRNEIDDRRVAVSGTVTYQGSPVEDGTISFAPAKGADGLVAGGRIQSGEYSIAANAGPSTGAFTVRIMVGKLQRPPAPPNPSFQINAVTVERDGRLDFDLPPE